MKKSAIFGFYGKSNTGKTTVIVDIIKLLSKKGFKIATVKISDKNIEIDAKGKDTWKFTDAGSKLVVLSSVNETDFILKQSKNSDEIINHINNLGDFDVIIIEGAKDKSIPKIRIGNIAVRENTVLTYNGDINKIVKIIEKDISRRN
jgi:molybdopterin-guanine dinucleotide biosynthesis protein B